MSVSKDYITYLLELLEPLEEIRAKRMFGGCGIFKEHIMFALVDDNKLYLKVDDTNRPHFEEYHMSPFTYDRKGKSMHLNYFETPDNILDDSEQLCVWAKRSYEIAVKNYKPKKK